MRLTENLTSEKSADTSGPRVESLIFLPGYAQNAEHTGLMLNSKVAGWCGKDEYRPKLIINTLKDRNFVSAQKAHFHISSVVQLTNQNLPTLGIKLCATMPTHFINVATKYVCSERTIFVETKQIIHGAW